MPASSLSIAFFLLLLILSCAPDLLSCTTTFLLGRRILHQPFFPLDSLPSSPSPPLPPPPPPQHTSPKLPLSTSTPNPSPFFPSYPALPPPPSPASFASFPANISSLILSNSPSPKRSSHKLVALAIAAVASAVAVVSIALLFYCRRGRNRRRDVGGGDKSFRSSNSHGIHPNNNTSAHSSRLRTSSTPSSEFLYLGTLVNSRAIDTNVGGGGGRKMDSPELHPLPPLARHASSRQNCVNAEVGSTGDDEDDVFYSPRVSLGGGIENSSAAGSGSRRAFEAVEDAAFGGGRSSISSSCSCSSSLSGTPARSHSISLSPPLSLSPRRSMPKSPELSAASVAPPHPASAPPPPPVSGLEQNPNACPSISYGSDQDTRSPSPVSSSERKSSEKTADVSLRRWNLSDHNVLSSSPIRSSDRTPIASPRSSNISGRPSTSLSPDRASDSTRGESPRKSNPLDRIMHSPARIYSALQQPFAASPPPPPPPPPPLPPPAYPLSQSQWEAPSPSTPIGQPMSKPPPLIPPSRPFVTLQNPPTISPMEPPPGSDAMEEIDDTPKPKLKPLHWDKVRASSDREMVWDQLRSSSFKLNEEMIETLFVVNTPNTKPKETTLCSVLPSPKLENGVLDPKKSQNIAILLRALNVTVEEVCEALIEGNADTLGTELLESLLKMAPSKEEGRKLKEYKDDSPFKLGPAEKFLKVLIDIPFAFERVEAMLYIANFESEIEYLKKSFETLEGACEELRNSRMFLKLLEAVLKTGNRMNVGTNRGDAHAFKLDTLLKLVDVKGADGKTTLLHFVVQEIIRTEGARLSGTNQNPNSTLADDTKCRKLGLQVVSGLSSELTNVKKAAAMDSDVLGSDVSKLSSGIENIREVVQLTRSVGLEENYQKFQGSMNRFMKIAEEEIIRIQAQESVALSLVKEITEYFHGNSAKEEAHPFRIFMVVRDFLTVLDRVCKEVGMINERTIISSAHKLPVPVNPTLPQVFPVNPTLLQHGFPGFRERRQYSSSDDENASP